MDNVFIEGLYAFYVVRVMHKYLHLLHLMFCVANYKAASRFI